MNGRSKTHFSAFCAYPGGPYFGDRHAAVEDQSAFISACMSDKDTLESLVTTSDWESAAYAVLDHGEDVLDHEAPPEDDVEYDIAALAHSHNIDDVHVDLTFLNLNIERDECNGDEHDTAFINLNEDEHVMRVYAAIDSGTNKRSVFNDIRLFPGGIKPYLGSLMVADGRQKGGQKTKRDLFVGDAVYRLDTKDGGSITCKNEDQLFCKSFPVNLFCHNKIIYNKDGTLSDHDVHFKRGCVVFNESSHTPTVVPIVRKLGLHCIALNVVNNNNDNKTKRAAKRPRADE